MLFCSIFFFCPHLGGNLLRLLSISCTWLCTDSFHLWEAEAIQSWPALHNKFQASHCYIVGPRLTFFFTFFIYETLIFFLVRGNVTYVYIGNAVCITQLKAKVDVIFLHVYIVCICLRTYVYMWQPTNGNQDSTLGESLLSSPMWVLRTEL